MAWKGILAGGVLLLLAVGVTYSNHFENSFHFDDFYSVKDNPNIRSLKNAGRFFTDPSTSSALPPFQTYRPLVTLSLALDYWRAGGIEPFYFHLDTFLWYLVQLLLMFALFRHILRLSCQEPWIDWAALFTVAVYGLHPAMAETVNYIGQRGDLYSTVLVVASLTVYALAPRLRRFGVYLLPAALAVLAAPQAAIFPAILFAYIFLFEERRAARALAQCIPAIAAAAPMLWLLVQMTPAAHIPATVSTFGYIATQPWVALHYFLMFFAPVDLTASSGQTALSTILSVEGIAGLLFLAAVIGAIAAAARRENLRPVVFGLVWFLLALIPASVLPLAEVESDRRMFFPFVGLALAVSWCVALLLGKRQSARHFSLPAYNQLGKTRTRRPWQPGLVGALFGPPGVLAALILAACAWGTHQRNRVWLNEESLWQDVTIKAPENGLGLANYARALSADNQPGAALEYFQRALAYLPNDAAIQTNLANAYARNHENASAEEHFRQAMQLAPRTPELNVQFGRWLRSQGRLREAIAQFKAAIAHNGNFLGARYALMQTYWDAGMQPDAKAMATETLLIAPGDATAQRFLNGEVVGVALPERVAEAEALVKQAPTAVSYLRLSGEYGRAGRFADCILAAQEALKLGANLSEAYNNIAMARMEMGEWDAAVAAAREAVRILPDSQMARNNLAQAEYGKKLAAGKQ